MTGRRSKRELKRAVEELEAERNAGDVTLTDLLLDDDPDDDAPADTDDALDVTFQYTVVMDREQAEREGREILGPADAPGDTVRVGDTDS